MMLKRSRELELELLRQIQAQQQRMALAQGEAGPSAGNGEAVQVVSPTSVPSFTGESGDPTHS